MDNNELKKALECCQKQFDCDTCECVKFCTQDIEELVGLSLQYIKQIEQKYDKLKEEYNRIIKIAKKMHTWFFLNTGDEQAVYDEMGLTDEDNALLGYGGKFVISVEGGNNEQ